MARRNPYGLYSLEMKGLGTLPMAPQPVGFSPTGTVSMQQTAPGATLPKATGWGAIPGTVQGQGVGVFPAMYRDRIANGARDGAGLAQSSSPGIAAALLSLRRALLALPSDASFNVSSAAVKGAMDFVLSSAEMVHRLNDGLVSYWPGVNVEQIENMLTQRVFTATGTTYSLPVKTPASSGSFSLPGSGGGSIIDSRSPTGGNTVATNVISQGGGGAQAANSQAQTVLDQNTGSGVTQIVPAGGPSDSIPGYGVNPVLNHGSMASGLPSWWKPALAITIGAMVGVGIGRVVAG